MKTDQQKLGIWGEATAADYLQSLGYEVLERNARTSYGEIDLIAIDHSAGPTRLPDEDSTVLVFIEVKTRSSTRYGLPEESITARKRNHLLNAIQAYMQSHDGLPGSWRVDVISILRQSGGESPEILHFQNAIT